ncbi:hypothetical protein CTEN210_10931 [Chaetoceros tenuissimus]|uniref:Uncharacterized protein n=1 Tax=Chaetoceros tenuissimus TaxID=426638 RepID=A0AAD3H8M5_9STRA|nr:hypothetical protein CTEN210_10931 [Chaetoceros tenuissimus]
MSSLKENEDVINLAPPVSTAVDNFLSTSHMKKSTQSSSSTEPTEVSEIPMISPVISAPASNTKQTISRKTLNRLKRKRLENTFKQAKFNFNTNVISCTIQQTSDERNANIHLFQTGNVFAHSLVSLNAQNHVAWEISTQNIMTDAALKNCENAMTQIKSMKDLHARAAIFSLTTSKESSTGLSLEALASMLLSMNAGICLSSMNGSIFVFVPRYNDAKELILACVNVLNTDRDVGKSDETIDTYGNGSSEKKQKTHDQEVVVANGDKSQAEETVTSEEMEIDSISIDALMGKYEQCLDQSEDAPSPIQFVTTAVSTISQSCKTLTQYDLSRLLRDTTTEGGAPLIISRSEIESLIRKRPTSNPAQNEGNDDSVSFSTQMRRLLRQILVQVLLRLQLLQQYSTNDNDRKIFFDVISTIDRTNKKSKKKKKKKSRKESSQPYTLKDYITDLCAVAENLSFVLPSSESFSSFFRDHVMIYYSDKMPSVHAEILDFFEIDIEEDDTSGPKETREVSSSRWAKCNSNLKSEPEQESVQTKPKEADIGQVQGEENLLLQNKKAVSVQSNRTNRLLAGSRGKYIGRQFSSSLFKEVKMVKTQKSIPKKSMEQPKHENKLDKARENAIQPRNIFVSETPISKGKNQRSIFASETPVRESRPRLSMGMGSLGASFSLRMNQTTSNNLQQKTKNSKGKNPHAAVIAAVKAMRKKR